MKVKCIKDTIGFKAGKTYEGRDGSIDGIEGNLPVRWRLSSIKDNLSEYFEEVDDESFGIYANGNIYKHDGVLKPHSWNDFPSKEAAEMEVLRRDSMANRWKPEDGESYCYFQFGDNKVYSSGFDCHTDFIDFFIGNTHKTWKDAQDWGKKYAEAFRYLLK